MKAFRLIRILLVPSILGATIGVSLSLIFLTILWIVQALQSPLFYDYFFGPHGLSMMLQESEGLRAFSDAVLAGSLSYNIFILLLAVLGAMMVYVALQLFDKTVQGVNSTLTGLHDTDVHNRHVLELQLGARLAIRIPAAVLWILYTFLFFKALLPFVVLQTQVGYDSGLTLAGAGYWVLSFGLLVVGLHIHVVLLRLLTLRLRLFGGIDAISAAIAGH